jgi:hypothetical protein
MQKAFDAMVTSEDLMQAIDEKRRGFSDATMTRLFKTEPQLALFIQSLAEHLTNQSPPKDGDLEDASRKAVYHLLVIVRAIEIGQHRLWRGSIDPSSPLGRMIDPAAAPKTDEKK